MRKFLLILIPVLSLIAVKSQAERITEYLQAQDWASANRELTDYLAQNPDKAWAYSSQAWALENLKRYDEAVSLARAGLDKWPTETKLRTALGRLLIKKAETVSAENALPLLKEAVEIDPREYTAFSLARAYRNAGNFAEALLHMEKGLVQYPDSANFREGLPFTRYQYFKDLRTRGDKTGMRAQIEKAHKQLIAGRTYDQYYYKLILRFGLRELGDRSFFQTTYDNLLAVYPEEPALYDDYGFQLYANYRLHDKADKQLRDTAISWRRKAYELYWKNRELPKPVTGLAFPLKGRNMIWSAFGGSAMTHNGFSQYCYDFAAVDAQRNIAKPGSKKKRNSDYFMFGKPAYAVADGVVSGTITGFPDNEPGAFSGDANTITIRHKGFLSFYAHIKDKGILVREGQKVRKGDLLGYVGNSGMSTESHLHFCINADNADDITIPFQFVPAAIEKKDGKTIRSSDFYKEDDVVIFE